MIDMHFSFCQCSVTCDKGVSTRAVRCRVNDSFGENSFCNADSKPMDSRGCFMGACPTTAPPKLVAAPRISRNDLPRTAYWRFGSWTEVSESFLHSNRSLF